MRFAILAALIMSCGPEHTGLEKRAIACLTANEPGPFDAKQTDVMCMPGNRTWAQRIFERAGPGVMLNTSHGEMCCDVARCDKVHAWDPEHTYYSIAYSCGAAE
jgi:hypothetical protein